MVLITNVFERALALLASQFRGTLPNGELTNLQKVIKAVTDPAQFVQDVEWQLKTERWLDTAVGQQLDEIGIILGLTRNPGESDEDYRERLKFQIFINISNGTPEQVIAVLQFLTKSTHIWYHELPYAAYQLETNGLTFPVPANDLNTALKRIGPAGVNYPPITATYNVEVPFLLGQDVTPVPLWVQPSDDASSELTNLLMEPYNSILYVSNGTVVDDTLEGGLNELTYDLAEAGQVAELIQINGNFPPRR